MKKVIVLCLIYACGRALTGWEQSTSPSCRRYSRTRSNGKRHGGTCGNVPPCAVRKRPLKVAWLSQTPRIASNRTISWRSTTLRRKGTVRTQYIENVTADTAESVMRHMQRGVGGATMSYSPMRASQRRHHQNPRGISRCGILGSAKTGKPPPQCGRIRPGLHEGCYLWARLRHK